MDAGVLQLGGDGLGAGAGGDVDVEWLGVRGAGGGAERGRRGADGEGGGEQREQQKRGEELHRALMEFIIRAECPRRVHE